MRFLTRLILIGLSGFYLRPAMAAGAPAVADVVLRIGGRGPRPYVALWIEDPAGKRIRTLRVWGDEPKHQRKLREWKKAAVSVDGISGATRPNGDYTWTWDGLDDDGNPVPYGTLVFVAESVREDGKHCKTSLTLAYSREASRAEAERDRDIQGLMVRTPSGGPLDQEGHP